MDKGIFNVHMQVMWNRLISVVEEQALTLLRTAFSTSVREAGDLSAGVFDEQGYLLRRFTASALDGGSAGVSEIGRVQLSNAVIAEAGTFSDRPGSRLVADHSKCQLELLPLTCVAVIGQFHISPFMLDYAHI